jgi:hypothetical protein
MKTRVGRATEIIDWLTQQCFRSPRAPHHISLDNSLNSTRSRVHLSRQPRCRAHAARVPLTAPASRAASDRRSAQHGAARVASSRLPRGDATPWESRPLLSVVE